MKIKKYKNFKPREFKNTPNKSYDVGNGKVVWDSRSVAVNVMVFLDYQDDIYVLIGKRGTGAADNIGKYNVPSGYLDRDETGPEAADREVWEETGFDLTQIDSLMIDDVIVDYLQKPWDVNTLPGANRQNVSLRYGVFLRVDELPELTTVFSEPNEVAEVKWEKLEYIDEYEWAYNHDELIHDFEQLLTDKGYLQ